MDLLLLFVFSPAILAQGYGKGDDPNDEPFLPIYPVYPYSPKLIKRGAEKAAVAQLSPEMYAPKVDAKESYSAGYNANYPRDPYYSNYNPSAEVSSPSNYGYYTAVPYSYPTAPYNSYSSHYTVPAPTYAAIPYASYPNYYYQPPYYYPNYYSQPLLPPPPSPPSATDYPVDPYSSTAEADSDKAGKTDDDGKGYEDGEANRFVDGANFVTTGTKDLDGQSSTYKTRNSQNELVQANDPRTKNFAVPLQRATYRVINVAGQTVAPDYALPAIYAKAQQLEELMSHAWPKLLAQNLPTTVGYPGQEPDAVETEQAKDKSRYAAVPKSGLAYIVNPSLFGKLNVGRSMGQVATTRLKSVKYPSLSQGVYATIEKPEQDRPDAGEYESYENSSAQSGSPDYDGPPNQTEKLRQSYENEATQAVSYRGQNYVTAQTPRGYDYSYRNYDPQRAMDQQQSQRYVYNLDDVNFGAKTKKV